MIITIIMRIMRIINHHNQDYYHEDNDGKFLEKSIPVLPMRVIISKMRMTMMMMMMMMRRRRRRRRRMTMKMMVMMMMTYMRKVLVSYRVCDEDHDNHDYYHDKAHDHDVGDDNDHDDDDK